MKIDELLQRKEKILHRCGMAPAARIRYSLMHAGLVFAILSLFVSSVIRLLMIESDMYSWTDGGKGCVFFCMIPVFCYLIYSIGQYFKMKAMEYCITDKGVYLQTGTGRKTSVVFVPYSHMQEICSDAETLDYGTVTCTLTRDDSGGVTSVPLKHIAEYKDVKQLIAEQLAMYQSAERKAIRRKADANTPADAVPLFAVADAFDAPLPDDLPEETVTDLQTELFGANAVPQGAFPDPTVNRLPELPESQQGQFLQQ